jgi:hypothetical protein
MHQDDDFHMVQRHFTFHDEQAPPPLAWRLFFLGGAAIGMKHESDPNERAAAAIAVVAAISHSGIVNVSR